MRVVSKRKIWLCVTELVQYRILYTTVCTRICSFYSTLQGISCSSPLSCPSLRPIYTWQVVIAMDQILHSQGNMVYGTLISELTMTSPYVDSNTYTMGQSRLYPQSGTKNLASGVQSNWWGLCNS